MVKIRCFPGRQTEFCWRCSRHRGNKIPLRSGSIFENSRLPFSVCVALLHWWSHNLSIKVTVAMSGLSTKHVITWHKMFRAICHRWLVANPRLIGGRNLRVEIDESLVARRKYHRGRLVPERWVFGGYCPDTHEGFLVSVTRRTAAILIPAIIRNIAPGSTIHSDMWRAYAR